MMVLEGFISKLLAFGPRYDISQKCIYFGTPFLTKCVYLVILMKSISTILIQCFIIMVQRYGITLEIKNKIQCCGVNIFAILMKSKHEIMFMQV